MTQVINAIVGAAKEAAQFIVTYHREHGYPTTVDTTVTGPYVVRVSSAKMPGTCWGRYEHVAILELVDGYKGRIPVISDRPRSVVRIVEVWANLFRGYSDKCAAAIAVTELQQKADKLNAAHLARAKKRAQAARRRANGVVYYRGAVPTPGDIVTADRTSEHFCCDKKHRTFRAAQNCTEKASDDIDHHFALHSCGVYGYDTYGNSRRYLTATRLWSDCTR